MQVLFEWNDLKAFIDNSFYMLLPSLRERLSSSSISSHFLRVFQDDADSSPLHAFDLHLILVTLQPCRVTSIAILKEHYARADTGEMSYKERLILLDSRSRTQRLGLFFINAFIVVLILMF